MSFIELTRPAYVVFLVLVTVYAFKAGGRDERIGSVIMVVASFISVPAVDLFDPTWLGFQPYLFVVDITALAVFVFLAVKSDRYWPIWMCSAHLVNVLSHVPMMFGPETSPWFRLLIGLWGFPMLTILAVGIWRHHRRAPAASNG